ncbi:MAG: hypothetical protein JRI23_29965 [Deltaproteobacteria bacterium]|jgi:hypothetical protein|nr:hypothetical protein [Deltaproteobacteria bacterium]MBW2536377.1 hypothetical protein [Deltaproteobacteria bacterium]
MRSLHTLALASTALLLNSACSSNDEYIEKLRAAMAQSDVTLSEVVEVAEAETWVGASTKAALLVDGAPVFFVRAQDTTETLLKYDIGLDGSILSVRDLGAGAGPCPGTISLLEALGIAEAEAGGVAVASVPDDDVACAFEVQVLTPDTLWEVKVGPDGRVLESEESDEDGVEDDD